MPKKVKFKPVITRVKLNPEQALVNCTCFSAGYKAGSKGQGTDPAPNICSTVKTWITGWIPTSTAASS